MVVLMNKFWNFTETNGERTLYLNGAIASETWWGDEITPQAFKKELNSGKGDVTVWINSPGGDVFAASQIYTMLKEYSGKVTVKIDGMAASAASVIAMSGDEVLMSPVSYMIIHNPTTVAIGDSNEMLKAKTMLDEIKEGIVTAYEFKTKLPREKISELMSAETCFNARKAVELGFADRILYENSVQNSEESFIFSRTAVTNSLITKLSTNTATKPTTRLTDLEKRLQNKKL
jgi:ATP-dependent Clp protease protease subunit